MLWGLQFSVSGMDIKFLARFSLKAVVDIVVRLLDEKALFQGKTRFGSTLGTGHEPLGMGLENF